LQGIEEHGHIALHIDEVIVLNVAFQLDKENVSWEKSCGSIQRVFIYNHPHFVAYNENK